MYSTNILFNLISTIFKTINSSVDDTRKTLALFNKDWNTYKTNWQKGFASNGFAGGIKSTFQSSNSIISPKQTQMLRDWNNAVKHGCTNQATFNRIIANADDNTKMYFAGLNKGKGSLEGLKAAQNATKTSTIGLTIAQTALNMAISMGFMAAISLAIKGFDKMINHAKRASEAADEAFEETSSKVQEQQEELKTLDELISKYRELKKDGTLDIEGRKEVKELQNDIADLVGTQARNLDLVNGKLDDEIKKLDKISAKEAKNAYETATANYNNSQRAKDNAAGDDSLFFFDGFAYTGKREKDAENILKEYGFGGNVRSGGFLDTALTVRDDYDNDMNALEGAQEKADYLQSMIDVLEQNGQRATELYSGLISQRDKYLGYIDSQQGAANSLVNSWITYSQYSNEELSNIAVNSAESLEAYRQKMIEAAKNDESVGKLLSDGTLSEKDLETAVNDFMATSTKFSDWYKQWIDDVQDTGENVNKMTVSLSDLEGASDKIGKLSSAFKELSDDGHITTKTLGEIKTATGLADDEWAVYESTLLNAKKGSVEFSQAMSDLTYKILEHEMGAEKLANATEEQIAAILRENGVLNANAVAESIVIAEKNKKLSQSTELAQAYLYEKIGVEELTKKTEEEIGALLTEANIESTVEQRTYLLAQAKDALRFKTALAKATTAEEVVALAMEASQAGITGNALNDLILDIGIFNNTNLDVSQKVAALQEMGYYAHWTAQGLSNIDKVKKYSLGGKNYIASYNKDGKLAWVEKEKEIDVPKVEIPKITIPNYSGAASGSKSSGSKGSGSDNKPDYEDPTDAIINRINLRSKEIEKQEEEIQNLIEIAELEKDYEKQISLANDLISTRKKRVEELNTANAALNNEAEYLRNSNSWDEDSWFDSQGNATEAYYALFNASSKEQQDQIKYLFEKLGKYKKAYQDNAKEIIALNKEIIQDERETIPQLWENLMDDSVSDIEHRIELRNNLVSPDYKSNIADYEEIKRLAHLRADAWREAGYGEDSEEVQKWQKTWWDAENSILDENRKIFDERLQLSEDYIQHSKDFGWENGDNEIKARKRVLNWIQSDYYKSLIKDDKEYYKILEEHRLNYLEAQKEEFDKANNFGSSVLDSRKTLLQSYFDATNSIVEAQHEINKELEASKTMYEWLDEDTRKLLFNQEDYNTLSEELYDIQYKADKLKRQYERDLNNSTLETVESITSNYQMQYETLMKSYEIAKADLEIAKKKQKLNNVLNERNVRMFIDGQWKWVANTEDVINAKSELADAEYAKRVEEAGLTQQKSINNLTKQQDELGVIINKFENGVIDLDDAVKMATQAIGRMPKSLSSMYSDIAKSSDKAKIQSSSSSVSKNNATATIPGLGTVGVHINDSGKTTTTGLPAGTVVHTDGGDYKITGGSSGNYSSIKVKNKYAGGTNNTKSGTTLMGEDDFEVYIDNNGHLIPIKQPTIFTDIEAGGKVFNTEQMKNLRPLWDLSNLNFGNSSFMSNIQPQQVSHAQDNRIIINGLTVDNGSTDGQALISALRRYVGNH